MRAAAVPPTPERTERHAPLDAAEVAARFGLSKDWLLRARKDLEAEGFPRPLPTPAARPRGRYGRGRPTYKWDRRAVETWFALQAPPELWPAMGVHLPANENIPEAEGSAAKLEGRLL